MAEHSSLTGADLHEPKGVASAASGKVYVANGSGSGNWRNQTMFLQERIDDVSNLGGELIAVPYAGTVTKIVIVVQGTVDVDTVLTATNAAGSSMGTATLLSANPDESVYTITPASNNTIADNSFMAIGSNGASTTAAIAYVTAVVEPSA